MSWIFIAVIAGSIVVSGHDTEEQCLGRKAIVEKDNKIVGTCIKAPSHSWLPVYNGSSIQLCTGITCNN